MFGETLKFPQVFIFEADRPLRGYRVSGRILFEGYF
jgi:hypothetical protein